MPNAPARLRKAVLPVAGLGTRVLPGTKTTPKELLNVVDRPILSYIVEEAREAVARFEGACQAAREKLAA